MYYYVVDEYRVSNELLLEDIYVCDDVSRANPYPSNPVTSLHNTLPNTVSFQYLHVHVA